MNLLDGKKLSDQKLEELKNKINNLTLAIISIGNDEASNVYIKQKAKMADYVGYVVKHKTR